MRYKECPNCGADITESYQSEDPDTGIIGGWYCEACDAGYADEAYEEDWD